MSQLLKHYSVDRDNPQEYAVSPEQFSRPRFGTIMPLIPDLNVVHVLSDENDIRFFLSTCPDEVVIEEQSGIQIITQQQWDDIIADHDARQEQKRYDVLRKYRNQLLDKTDWIVVKSLDTEVAIAASFKAWRQELRDLPDSQIFPQSIPECPEPITIEENFFGLYNSEVRSFYMVNDPLPPIEENNPVEYTPPPEENQQGVVEDPTQLP